MSFYPRPEDAMSEGNRPGSFGDLYRFTAEFYTERRIIVAELRSAEVRLVDHLNSSDPTTEVRPQHVTLLASGARVELGTNRGYLNKSRLYIAIPVVEPPREAGAHAAAWKTRVRRRCFAGIGPYRVVGTVAAEIELNQEPRLPYRQFLSVTAATITFPDGTARDIPYLVLNRLQADVLALDDD